jgi:Xaa-Pro aminopeptidase
MDRFAERRDRLRQALKKAKVDALLVTNYTNVTYLTGFTGDDSYLLVTPKNQIVISDARYTTQLEEECRGLETHIRPPGQGMLPAVEKLAKQAKLSRVGIEGDSMTVGFRERMAAKLGHIELVTTSGVVEELRMCKDKEEVAEIRRAVDYAQQAFTTVRKLLHPEQTEKEVADSLEHQMRREGGTGASFPSIVAVGDRAALPHYRPGQRRISEAPFVLIDWGAVGRGYVSDLTRVLVTGKIPPKLERIYGVVLNAQERAIDAIKPGMTCDQIDAVARKVIDKAGFGRRFGHGLGHGIGLEIHEAPRLTKGCEVKLKPGMVVTVEPGIYVPGFGGVRIEDDVLVTRSGGEVLTSLPKQWEDAIVG